MGILLRRRQGQVGLGEVLAFLVAFLKILYVHGS